MSKYRAYLGGMASSSLLETGLHIVWERSEGEWGEGRSVRDVHI